MWCWSLIGEEAWGLVGERQESDGSQCGRGLKDGLAETQVIGG